MQKGDFGAEGREGAGAVRLGGWCQGRGRRWRCSPWKLYVFILKVCGSNDLGGSSAPQLVNLAVHSLCELSLYQNKKIAKFSCEHEIWLFLYFGTALSEDKVLFIPQ